MSNHRPTAYNHIQSAKYHQPMLQNSLFLQFMPIQSNSFRMLRRNQQQDNAQTIRTTFDLCQKIFSQRLETVDKQVSFIEVREVNRLHTQSMRVHDRSRMLNIFDYFSRSRIVLIAQIFRLSICVEIIYNNYSSEMKRLDSLAKQIIAGGKDGGDVVICSAVRTPVTKAKKGGLRDTAPEVMLSCALLGAIERAKLDPKLIGDIAIGNNLQPGAGQITNRMGMFLAEIPDTTPIVAINRLCSSGLQSCAIIASKIKSGEIDIGIGGGVESMSLYSMKDWVREDLISKDARENQKAMLTLMSMGVTSENVAQRYGITREKQDLMAYESHQKAAQAQEAGLFKSEIVPVKTTIKNEKGEQRQFICFEDDGIRGQTKIEGLGKLKTVFKKDGTTTAGNSSQISDGAAAVVLARRSTAQKLGLPVLAKFVHYATKGCPPEIMGIGPAVAIPQLLAKTGKTVKDIDIWQINEAFASQATYCVQKLGIDKKKLNPKGGAIALGHPLGCTGARQIATLIPELYRTNSKLGVVSMCIGTGMGAAALIEKQ